MTGSINKEYPLEVDLIRNNDTIFGECFMPGNTDVMKQVDNTGHPMLLCGKVLKDGSFVLTLNPWGKSISFKGHFISARAIAGTCDISGSGKNLPFELIEKYTEGSIPMNAYFQKGSVALVRKPASPSARIRLSMLLPGESANPIVSDSLKRLIISRYTDKEPVISDPEKILNGIAQVYYDTYVSSNIDIYEKSRGQSFNWELLNYMHVVQNNSHILAFYTEQYAFTGGAHGLQNRRYTVINLNTGKVISVREIFQGNYEAKLKELLTQKAKENYSVPANKTLIESGFFVNEIMPNSNFYVTRTGVGFYYNQYDIAPYSNGQTELFLPFTEIRDILVNDGIMKSLIN